MIKDERTSEGPFARTYVPLMASNSGNLTFSYSHSSPGVEIGSVVSIDLSEEGDTILFTEECDLYYWARMNKEQFGRFIELCQAIHQQMK